ncbi:MAG: ABC1 kinase family protein [Gemmataceae bacterium]
MLRYLSLRVRGQLTPTNFARDLRHFFERMGFLWVKIGQLMAMRNDLYSDEFCRELGKLRYKALGFSLDVARQMVEEELARPLEDFFSEFDPVPFRAALTYQIHRATLRDSGDWVAVKVQRPGIEAVFHRDLNLFRRLIALLGWLGIHQQLRWDELHWELNQAQTTETDYRYEAANMRRMRRMLRKRQIYVPKVFERLSGRRVLVMEFVRGALMSDVAELTNSDPTRLAFWLTENRINLRLVGKRLFSSFLRHLMEDNFFHGNLHPGNIVLLRDSRFAFIDLSVLITVESEFLRRYVQSMRALATYHYGRAADLTLLLCPELPVIDLASLKERMVRCFRAWDARSQLKRMPYHEKSLASVYGELNKILYSCDIIPTLTFMKICYNWATLDDSLTLLIPDENYSRLFRNYFKSADRRFMRNAFRGRSLMQALMSLKDTVSEYQQLLAPMLRRGALVFRGGTTKLSDAMASVLRLMRWAVLGGMIYLTFHLLDLHVLTMFDVPIIEHLKSQPRTDYELITLILVVGTYLFRMLGTLERRFRQHDVRLPNTTAPSLTN